MPVQIKHRALGVQTLKDSDNVVWDCSDTPCSGSDCDVTPCTIVIDSDETVVVQEDTSLTIYRTATIMNFGIVEVEGTLDVRRDWKPRLPPFSCGTQSLFSAGGWSVE